MSTVCVTDAELVALARQGDHEAFGELVTRHQTAVYRAALAAVGSPAEAEDASQDAFVSAYRRLGSFRGDASFKTWLLTIAWNHAINRRRRLTRWLRRSSGLMGQEGSACGHASPRTSESEGEHQRKNALGVGPQRQWKKVDPLSAEDLVSNEPSPEQTVIDAQLQRDIAAEIRALSPKLRDALLLAQSGEYGYDEIAAMLGTAVGTIKWRVSEARRVIRLRMRERGYADVG
jgi:RNA polymerase sigma-70 factor, ECF subfamily